VFIIIIIIIIIMETARHGAVLEWATFLGYQR
jgi:hypothetical protein